MKLEDIPIVTTVCNVCYPNNSEEVCALAPHLLKDGKWVGGFTKAKMDELGKICEEFEKDRKTTCVYIDPEDGTCICKKHLLELVEKMGKQE